MRINRADISREMNWNDPRMHLPVIIFYGQGSLGCTFLATSMMAIILLVVTLFIEEEVRGPVQWFLVGMVLIWVLTWVFNYGHVIRLARKGKSGVAWVVDKFIYEYKDDDEVERYQCLVYEFDDRDSGDKQQVLYRTSIPREFNVPVGHRQPYVALPTGKIVTNITNKFWHETWTSKTPQELSEMVTGHVVTSGIALAGLGLAILWIRTAMAAARLDWQGMLDRFTDRTLWGTLTTPELVLDYWETILQMPGVVLAIVVAVLVSIGGFFFHLLFIER